jgi:hypothetical protein
MAGAGIRQNFGIEQRSTIHQHPADRHHKPALAFSHGTCFGIEGSLDLRRIKPLPEILRHTHAEIIGLVSFLKIRRQKPTSCVPVCVPVAGSELLDVT